MEKLNEGHSLLDLVFPRELVCYL